MKSNTSHPIMKNTRTKKRNPNFTMKSITTSNNKNTGAANIRRHWYLRKIILATTACHILSSWTNPVHSLKPPSSIINSLSSSSSLSSFARRFDSSVPSSDEPEVSYNVTLVEHRTIVPAPPSSTSTETKNDIHSSLSSSSTQTKLQQQQQQHQLKHPPNQRKFFLLTPLKTLQFLSFLHILSNTLVAFSPAPALISHLNLSPSAVASLLSSVSALAALFEIFVSPIFGSLLDGMIGRKGAIVACISIQCLVHFCVAVASSWGWSATKSGTATAAATVIGAFVCLSKFLDLFVTGLLFIAVQATVSDIVLRDQEGGGTSKNVSHSSSSSSSSSSLSRLGSIMGAQKVAFGGGFLIGCIAAGQLTRFHLSVPYLASTIMGLFTLSIVTIGLEGTSSRPSKSISKSSQLHSHTNPPNNNNNNSHRSWKTILSKASISCTNLLHNRGREMRLLSILLILQEMPKYVGDFFQIYATAEWNLTTMQFSTFVGMFGIVGILANAIGSILLPKMGVRKFTSLAIASSAVTPLLTAMFGFRGTVAGMVTGFLGAAQSMGVMATMVSKGASLGIPQGELAGERLAMIALVKVFAPLFYSQIYRLGKSWLKISSFPFLWNFGLAVGAFVICQMFMVDEVDVNVAMVRNGDAGADDDDDAEMTIHSKSAKKMSPPTLLSSSSEISSSLPSRKNGQDDGQ